MSCHPFHGAITQLRRCKLSLWVSKFKVAHNSEYKSKTSNLAKVTHVLKVKHVLKSFLGL